MLIVTIHQHISTSSHQHIKFIFRKFVLNVPHVRDLTGIRLRKSLLLLALVAIGYITFYTSCANIGVPSGGLKDTIPPVVLKSIPANNQINIKDNEIKVTFDELIKN